MEWEWKWTNSKCLQLIEEYSKNLELWNPNNINYKNRDKRKQCWARISEKFNCPQAEIERKMNVLLTQYRREKSKISYGGEGEIRPSRWYAFNKLSFLENYLKRRKKMFSRHKNTKPIKFETYTNLQEATTTTPTLPNHQGSSSKLVSETNMSDNNSHSPIDKINYDNSETTPNIYSIQEMSKNINFRNLLHHLKIPTMLENEINIKHETFDCDDSNNESEQYSPRDYSKISDNNFNDVISTSNKFHGDNAPKNYKLNNENGAYDCNDISNKFLSMTSSAIQDNFDFIGLNVSLKLRSMNDSQRIIAEKLISDILFFGQFNELDRSATICPSKAK